MARTPDQTTDMETARARAVAARSPLNAWQHPRHDPSLEHAEQSRLLGALTAGQAIGLAAWTDSAEAAGSPHSTTSLPAAQQAEAASGALSSVDSSLRDGASVPSAIEAGSGDRLNAPTFSAEDRANASSRETRTTPSDAVTAGVYSGQSAAPRGGNEGFASVGFGAAPPLAVGSSENLTMMNNRITNTNIDAVTTTNANNDDPATTTESTTGSGGTSPGTPGGTGTGGGGGNSENGGGGTTGVSLPTTPGLSIAVAAGQEDHAIALSIAVSPLPSGEVGHVSLGGLPIGFTLSAGTQHSDGSWSLTLDQLPGLSVTPPSDWSGAVQASVTVSAQNAGGTTSSTAPLHLLVAGLADPAILHVTAASGIEDQGIPLTITAALADTDVSESLSLRIDHLPVGATLSAGTALGNGQWLLAPGDLAGLILTPPVNFNGNLVLDVTAVSTESTGDQVGITAHLNVGVTPVADVPILTLLPASGVEDAPIALHIAAALGTNATESLSIDITGVPVGAVLSAGTLDSGGVWHLTPGQLAGLTLTPPNNSDTGFTLAITATSEEAGGTSAVTHATLPVTLNGVADIPSAHAALAIGLQNVAVPLSLGGTLMDTDGSEWLSFVVRGVPSGFSLNHGIDNGDHSWTLTPVQLSGLTLTTPLDYEGRVSLSVTAVAHEDHGSIAASAAVSFQVDVGDVAQGIAIDLSAGIDPGNLALHLGLGAQTNLLDPAGLIVPEDAGAIALPDAGLLTALHAGVTQYLFCGLPAGASISGGTYLGNGIFGVAPGSLSNLHLVLPPNSDQDFTLILRGELLGGLVTIDLHTTPVHVIGMADAPSLSLSPLTGIEGTALVLGIQGALMDTDGSESLSYRIHDLPPGFTLNAGIQNEDGGWSLTPAELSGLTLTAPAHWSGDTTFTVSAISTEREGDWHSTSLTAYVHMDAVASAPVITIPDLSGTQGGGVLLNLGVALGDADGSEHLASATLSGLPTGTTLSYGTDNHDGSWNLDLAHLNDTRLTPATSWSGDTTLSIHATSEESNGTQATSTVHVALHMEATAATPSLSVSDSTGNAGSPIALHLSASGDVSDHLSVILQHVPVDATLSAGMNDGQGNWVMSSGDLHNLTLTPGANAGGDVALTLWGHATDPSNGATADSHQNFTLHVTPDPLHGLEHLLAGH